MANLALNLVETKDMYPERAAVRLDELVLTYEELDERSARVAGLLAAQGVERGDRVALMLPNVPQFPVLYYGVLRAGAVVVPMNPLLKAREVQYYLEDSGAGCILVWDATAAEAAKGAEAAGAGFVPVAPGTFDPMLDAHAPGPAVADRADDDTAVILYTSGTTGRPKGAELTHANLARNAAVTATTLLRLEPDDVVMGCLPLFHSFGQTCGLNAAVGAGASLTLLPRFDPGTALEVIQRAGSPSSKASRRCMSPCSTTRAAATRTSARCGSACRAAPPSRSRCCGASRTASAASSWRATGCRRPPRWPRSTIPTASASPAPSAPPSRASSCGWSAWTTPACRPARSARSPFAATTS
jgi:acyl-CoA synthetase (AMP-forming)/AMP-acid ligase II